MKYHTVLFDADDTLYDYNKAEEQALLRTFEAAGFTVNEQLMTSYRVINKQLWIDLEQGLIKTQELRTERFQRLLDREKLITPLNTEELSQTYINNLAEGFFLKEGAVELCHKLEEKGCRMAIVTNGIREVQLSRISKSDLRDTFKHIIVSEDTGYQKPHTGFFEYAFKSMSLTGKEGVLIVGDSLTSDIQGGLNFGLDTCWFNPNHLENRTGIVPKYEIHALSELLQLLEG